MSDEGTTQDALRRLKQVDPERYAEIMERDTAGEQPSDPRYETYAEKDEHL